MAPKKNKPCTPLVEHEPHRARFDNPEESWRRYWNTKKREQEAGGPRASVDELDRAMRAIFGLDD